MALRAKRIDDDVAPTLLANLGDGDYVNSSVAVLIIEKPDGDDSNADANGGDE